jgi:hypothetical protein
MATARIKETMAMGITANRTTFGWSLPRIMLHSEGFAVFVAAIALYAQQGFSWWAFALLLLAPDLAMVGYLLNQRTGTIAYNIFHTYNLPITVGLLSFFFGWGLGLQLALIWFAHIGMDRTVGYGLKYSSGFKDTHLGRV